MKGLITSQKCSPQGEGCYGYFTSSRIQSCMFVRIGKACGKGNRFPHRSLIEVKLMFSHVIIPKLVIKT